MTARRSSARRAFALGVTTGAFYFWGTLYWLVTTMTTFGGLSTLTSAFAALLLVAYLALFPGLFALFQSWFAESFGRRAVLLAPAVWVATEMGRTYIWDGFPWELLGYSQVTVLPVAQAASVAGVYGLSALVASVSGAAAYVALEPSAKRWRPLAGALVIVIAIGGWGAFRIRGHRLTSAGTPIRVGVLQGNIPQDQKWDSAQRGPILERYVNMTREAIGRGAQFVLWPESSTPEPYEQDLAAGAEIRRLAQQSHITLLIGSDQVEPVRPEAGKTPQVRYYNAAYLVQPDGTTGAIYRKIHLVPFGEYVPLKRVLFFVGPIVDAVSDFTPGDRVVMLPVAGHLASTAICYEVIYSSLIRAFVVQGSELLTTITNDAWYGWTSAAYQHWEQASMRAIEEGRYLARAANTGISGFIDPYGRVMQASNMFQSAVMVDELRFIQERTIYSYVGDVAGWIGVALTALLVVIGRRRRL